MWRGIWVLSFVGVAWGQILLAPGSRQEQELERFFGSSEGVKESPEMRLSCRITPLPPRLSFGFQNWTGFDIGLPVRQFSDKGRERPIAMAIRVQPQAGSHRAHYFYSRAALPRKVPAEFWSMKNVEMNLGGGFVLGEGKYKVSFWLMDGAGRTCRKSWNVNAKAQGVPMQIEPGHVAETGMESWKGMKGGRGKLSIYMHAAPVARRRVMTRLSSWDRAVLMSSLRSILDVGGYASARVTVFNFDGRKVVFTSDNFDADAYERLMDALLGLNLGTVSYQTLKGPDEEEFLRELIRDEAEKKEASDAVVFLGPSWRWGQKVSPLLRELRSQLPPVYYISLTPWQATATDLIEKFVKAGPQGRVLSVYQPVDLAKAIREIRERRN